MQKHVHDVTRMQHALDNATAQVSCMKATIATLQQDVQRERKRTQNAVQRAVAAEHMVLQCKLREPSV